MTNTASDKGKTAAGTAKSAQDGRIAKAINQYKGLFLKKGKAHREGIIRVNDITDIVALSGGEQFELINNALMAGFMIGYRKGKRDKKARACCQH